MNIKDDSLPPSAVKVIRHKATEAPHSGDYNSSSESGTYLCRACGSALFRSRTKFNASCGWPSFDEAMSMSVAEVMDADGRRQEIVCAQCNAHLGHVFDGEGFTHTNRRYCVNSLSLDFVRDAKVVATEEAVVAGGCFWGVQYLLGRVPGVLKTEVGYTGGSSVSPSYSEVCSGLSGHFEAVRVLYNPEQIDYETLITHFFEIHDPTQQGGQGPDRGQQYQSVIFYYTDKQKKTAEHLIRVLEQKGYQVATQLKPVSVFWLAETNHQDYYEKNGHTPYCHAYTKRF